MSRQTISKLLFSQQQVAGNASAIYEAVLQGSPNLRRGNFERLSSADLAFLFRQYDERVFTGLLQNKLEEADATPIRFRPSGRLTKNGGYTKQIKRDTPKGRRVSYEIAIAADMLFQAFNEDHREITVNGGGVYGPSSGYAARLRARVDTPCRASVLGDLKLPSGSVPVARASYLRTHGIYASAYYASRAGEGYSWNRRRGACLVFI